MRYLPDHDKGLAALKSYKYVGADHSLVYKYLLSPWAEWVLRKFIPLWAAPNLITLVGLVFQIVAFVVLAAHCPTMTESPPPWTAGLAGFCLFTYSTLDNVDGKQARRTGSSSPLGLLFDHGLDAINGGFFGPLNMAMVIGSAATGWRHIVSWLLATLPFFFNTWEEYWIGEFHLPIVNGPNEGLMILCAGYVATAVLGTGFWAQPVTFPPLALVAKAVSPVLNFMRWCAGESGDVIGSGSLPASFVTWTDLVLSFTMAGVILTLLSNCVTVTRYCLRTPGLGWRGVAQAHAQLLPFLTLLSAIGLWMHVPATKAVQVAHPFAWYTAVGWSFADLTSKLMVAHVCDQHYSPRWSGIGLLAATPILAHAQAAGWAPQLLKGLPTGSVPVEHLLWLAVVICVKSLVHFALVAPREIADALDIDVFDISRQRARAAAAAAAAAKAAPAKEQAASIEQQAPAVSEADAAPVKARKQPAAKRSSSKASAAAGSAASGRARSKSASRTE